MFSVGNFGYAIAFPALSSGQEEKLDKIRVARASDSATEAALWFTKEGGFFDKNGTLAKYFKSNDRGVLDESYEWIVRQNFSLPPYPAVQGLATILKSVEARNPKAKTMKPEDFVDMRYIQEIDKSGFISDLSK